MKNVKLFTAIFFSLFISKGLFGQGCSDAGICTINSIKDQSFSFFDDDNKRNTIKTGLIYGIGEFDIKYTNPYVAYSNNIIRNLSLSAKLGYSFISGELANTNNLSDIVISANYYVLNKEFNRVSVVLGIKIPLNDANVLENGQALPMHYQNSLGTYDLIVGVNGLFNKFGVSLALQQPVSNSNENEFFKPLDSNETEYKYQSTNTYDRKADIMNRISYNIVLYNKRFVIRPSVLTIYHLGNDTYIDENDAKQEIKGSEGLTLNGNIFLVYNISETKLLELSIGSPFITRDARPDGLTRKVVVGLEYAYSF